MFLDLFVPFFIGLAGSLHCLGMCGPLVMAYSLHLRPDHAVPPGAAASCWGKGIAHHAAFHLGRILTYGFLGALAAGVAQLTDLTRFFSGFRSGVTLGGGLLMVLFGLLLLKVLPFSLLSLPSFGPHSFWRKLFFPLFESRRLVSRLALGLAAGFLPCMLSWALVIQAATTQNPLRGFFTTTLFGLGTVPVLFLAGLSASFLSLKTRLYGERVAAVSVMVMGFILIFKGSKYFV